MLVEEGMAEPINLDSLSNAVQRLTEGYDRYQQDTSDTQIRDGLIQRFEFTYEIAHKTLKRYMESVSANPEQYDEMPFADLIRSANEQGLLLSAWPKWKIFREMRARTSHTYDEKLALEVVKDIPLFLDEVRFLLAQLSTRNKA